MILWAPLGLSVAHVIGTPLTIGVSIFILGLLSMLVSSTMYHYAVDAERKWFWKRADHICIYFAIAGSYTPFIIQYLWTPGGITLLIAMWTMAVCGVIFKVFTTGRLRLLSTLMYVLMGLSILWVSPEFFPVVPMKIKQLLVGGGLSYLIGVIFYLMKSWDYHHPVWHLFVLVGAGSHTLAVWHSLQV